MASAIFVVRDVTSDTSQREELMKMGKIVEAMTNFVVVVDRDEENCLVSTCLCREKRVDTGPRCAASCSRIWYAAPKAIKRHPPH